MGLSTFINDAALNSNLSVLFRTFDTDNNGFTRTELSNAINGVSTRITRGILKITKYDKKLFYEVNTNHDDIVSYEEIAKYIEKEYGLNLDQLKKKNLIDVCNDISDANKKKKEKAAKLNMSA